MDFGEKNNSLDPLAPNQHRANSDNVSGGIYGAATASLQRPSKLVTRPEGEGFGFNGTSQYLIDIINNRSVVKAKDVCESSKKTSPAWMPSPEKCQNSERIDTGVLFAGQGGTSDKFVSLQGKGKTEGTGKKDSDGFEEEDFDEDWDDVSGEDDFYGEESDYNATTGIGHSDCVKSDGVQNSTDFINRKSSFRGTKRSGESDIFDQYEKSSFDKRRHFSFNHKVDSTGGNNNDQQKPHHESYKAKSNGVMASLEAELLKEESNDTCAMEYMQSHNRHGVGLSQRGTSESATGNDTSIALGSRSSRLGSNQLCNLAEDAGMKLKSHGLSTYHSTLADHSSLRPNLPASASGEPISRGVIAGLEAEIMDQEYEVERVDTTQNHHLGGRLHSTASSARGRSIHRTITNNVYSSVAAARRGSPDGHREYVSSNAHSDRRGSSLSESSYRDSNRYFPRSNNSHNNKQTRTTRNGSVAALCSSDGTSRDVIANMEALFSRAEEDEENSSGAIISQNSHTDRGRHGTGPLGRQSRQVIASLEADISRQEEEQERMELIGHQILLGPNGPNAPVVPVVEAQQRGLLRENSNLAWDRQPAPQPGRSNRRLSGGSRFNLADRISNMALGDEESSASSTCASYDGKCSDIFGIRAQTHVQDLACHELHDAICDLYDAPVRKILKAYPMATRLIRADDESGNVQLHYAVRNGNVKAIRRILRADPSCALIRNAQGHCPLHFAAQIGNFAASQILCAMVPAAAEVQCEEGNLPLHDVVSSASHHPDAPQITAALINAFPTAIKITNDEGLLPLHLAAMSGFSAGIRTIFAYGFSTIYARENTEEMLPLDFAVDEYYSLLGKESEGDDEPDTTMDHNEENVQVEEEENEPANQERDPQNIARSTEKEVEFRQCIDILLMSALYDRPVMANVRSGQLGMLFLPIHGAAASQPCRRTWKRILSMYGGDYDSDVDVRGRTALHILLSSKMSNDFELVAEMVTDLALIDPDAVSTFDDSGLTPLHAALINKSPLPIVQSLMECDLCSITTEVGEDCDHIQFREMLPFQLAAASGCSVDVINLLLRSHPMSLVGATTSCTNMFESS